MHCHGAIVVGRVQLKHVILCGRIKESHQVSKHRVLTHYKVCSGAARRATLRQWSGWIASLQTEKLWHSECKPSIG